MSFGKNSVKGKSGDKQKCEYAGLNFSFRKNSEQYFQSCRNENDLENNFQNRGKIFNEFERVKNISANFTEFGIVPLAGVKKIVMIIATAKNKPHLRISIFSFNLKNRKGIKVIPIMVKIAVTFVGVKETVKRLNSG